MDELIRQITEDFVAGMSKTATYARRQIIALIKAMETDNQGNLIYSDRNAQLIDGASLGIYQVAQSNAFQGRVDQVIKGVPKLRQKVERDFIVQHGIIRSETLPLLNNLEARYTEELQVVLGDESVTSEIVSPMIAVLNQMVIQGMTKDAALSFAGEKVPSLFTQFAFTRVDTILQQYARAQIKVLATAKGLIWNKYSGPVGPTALGNEIRPFCRHRVGRAYLDAEVASWSTEIWEGKIPGTNRVTIFTNLGGYNCRHILTPVAYKDVPERDRQRARKLGLL